VLGLRPAEQQWRWNAFGKHPVAKDFIRLGRTFPLAISMAEWVDKGYSVAKGSFKPGRQSQFWRFWARGTVNGELACGVLRDSSDSIGREYPFLVLGSGQMSSWQENWDLIPAACERVWNRTEYLCTRNQTELAGLERELVGVRPPEPKWRDYRTTREAFMKDFSSRESVRLIESRLKRPLEEQVLRMELDMELSDLINLASHILGRIKADGKALPNTVFIGGTFAATSLMMYWRPLAVEDFRALWG